MSSWSGKRYDFQNGLNCRLPYFASDRWWLQLERQRRTGVILDRVCPKVVGEQAVLDDEVDAVGERIEAAVRADAEVSFNRKNLALVLD